MLFTALPKAVASAYSAQAAAEWEVLTRAKELTIDWPELCCQATRLGLAPLLYQALRHERHAQAPPEVMEALREGYIQTATQNALAMHTLSAVVQALLATGVPVILLKGAALLASVYEDMGLRPMVDLDLLIPFQDLDRCLAALAEQGYHPAEIFPFEDKTGSCWSQLQLVRTGRHEIVLELHWHLLDNPYYAQKLSADALFPRTRQVTSAGQPVRILNPEEQILHLCAHSLYHHGAQLARTFVDLAYVVDFHSAPVDWDYLLAIAAADDVVLALKKVLVQAAHEWYVPVPATVLEQLESLHPRPVERFFVATQRSEFLKVLRTLLMLPGWTDKTRFAYRQLFPTRSFMSWRYGASPSKPLFVAYAKRYIAGIQGLVGELTQ